METLDEAIICSYRLLDSKAPRFHAVTAITSWISQAISYPVSRLLICVTRWIRIRAGSSLETRIQSGTRRRIYSPPGMHICALVRETFEYFKSLFILNPRPNWLGNGNQRYTKFAAVSYLALTLIGSYLAIRGRRLPLYDLRSR